MPTPDPSLPPQAPGTLGPPSAPTSSGPTSKRTSTLSPMDPPELPDEIGRLGGYRILRIIGHGGMGVVYEAEDPNLRRRVAIKCLLSEVALREGNKDRFLREARATAAIDHDNVISIYQIGTDHEVPFMVMQLLKGQTLKARLEHERKLPLPEVIRITREICQGLKAAHDRGLIHRDIKPENIWLDADTGRVRILDFGLARINDDAEMRSQGGHLVGTPGYISPEQIAGDEVDVRADLFSLGCLLYEMATGQPPFSGANFLVLLSNVTTQTPESPNVLNPQLPGILSALILKLIEKERDRRPVNVQEVLDILSHFEPNRTSPPPPPPSPPVRVGSELGTTQDYAEDDESVLLIRKPARKPPLVLFLTLLVLLLVGVGAGLVFLYNQGNSVVLAPTSSPRPTGDSGSTIPSSTPPTASAPTSTPKITPPTQAPPTPEIIPKPKPKPQLPPGAEAFARGLQLLRQEPEADYAQAFALFQKAATANYSPAYFQVGYAQFYGLGTRIDRIAALNAYHQGDQAKEPLATFALGLSECEGTGQRRNTSRGEARIRTSLSAVTALAEKGDTQAMILLGDALLEGYGVSQDREAATTWFRKAALENDPNGLNHLANCYKEGWGVVQDDDRRFSFLKQARDRGFPLSYALLGDLYRERNLAPPNLVEAAKMYRQAADAGFAPARLRLASVLSQLKQTDEASQAFSQAMAEIRPWAEAGDMRAQYDLSVLYIRDNTIPDYQRLSAEWMTKSAEQGYVLAEFRLGRYYWDGIGVEKNPNQARLWYRKAADQGHQEAAKTLEQIGP